MVPVFACYEGDARDKLIELYQSEPK